MGRHSNVTKTERPEERDETIARIKAILKEVAQKGQIYI